MFTGASNAEVAIVLVDARLGVVRQTRRHAQIAALLGIRHVVVGVNKMDLIDWDPGRFAEVTAQVEDLARRLGILDVSVIPISALGGDNIAAASANTPYYDGPTLLDYLEAVDVQADRDVTRLRLPIQWVGRPRDGGPRIYTGRLEAGTVRVGDRVVVLPSGGESTIASLDALDPEVTQAAAPMSVAVTLSDHLDLGRGDMLVDGGDPPPGARELDATLCWMSEEPLRAGRRYALKHTTRTVRATVQALHERTDPETLERQEGQLH